jgi:hypothetical protein
MGKKEYARQASNIRLWKWLASSFPVYGNGSATMSYSLCNCVLRFMEMAGKQFSRLWKWFCNHVLQLV